MVTRRALGVSVAVWVAVPVLLSSAGCQRGVVIREEVVRAKEGMVLPGPFAPAEMRVHPLTHAEMVEGRVRVVLHVEIRDGWGDTIKGVGRVTVRLRKSGASTMGESGVKWEIDLRDLATNVSYFDSVTRTYRFVISGLPDWFEVEGRGKMRVLFRTARADGKIESMQDDFEILSVSSDGG